MSGFIHFVIGGSRSGKSHRAESLAIASGQAVAYIATYAADPCDKEMRTRVERHRQQRPLGWRTIENRFDLESIVRESTDVLLLLDCLTLWLSFHLAAGRSLDQILSELEQALQRVREFQRSLIIVSNEVGAGLVPSTPQGRTFRDLCGLANQLVATHATIVELIVAGLPLVLKGGA
ncbi:MAG TPA: bifunctional adenosylcobinamide kinase/adenosylcobinamide-phosphate guanylyltransferase [Chthoniobacterales bacterium]|nr:bifunctional adenosylcobinamide kinase/adenosylcobinamide-phosphate guanylyltransferase [Chthoniobacterales bacterium]